MTVPPALLACRTADEVKAYVLGRHEATHPPQATRSVTRNPDGSRITDSGLVKAALDWRRWQHGFEARQLAALTDYDRRERFAAKAGRPEPRWGDDRKPVTIAYGDTVFEVGPGGALRRAAAPSHVPTAGAPRAVAPPAVRSTPSERHRRSEAAKARHRARQEQAPATHRASRDAAARALEVAHLRGRSGLPGLMV